MIKRTIKSQIEESIKNKPVTLITGARQVGKSTLCYEIKKEHGFNYVSLDDRRERAQAISDPELFLKMHNWPLIIDEVQYAPALYIYIQNDSNNEDIFVAFSSSLSDALSNTKSYFEAFNKLNDTLKEYKDYFANQTPSLSKIEEQGLYCELYELSNLIDKFGEKIILNWLGPSKNKRDFVFNKCAIEVKSTSTQLNCLLKISNENQLDNQYPKELCGPFLSVYIIEEENEGYDVASLANEIYQKIESVQLRHTFSLLLLKMKVDIEQYKPNFKFKIQKKTYYRVDDSFPKITKSNVDSNICNVSYSIKIDNLSKFIIDEEKVYEQL